MRNGVFALFWAFFAAIMLSGPALAASGDSYFNVQLPHYIEPATTTYVYGTVYVDGVASANKTVNAYLYNSTYSSSNSSVSSSTGAFNISLPIPRAEGQFNLLVNSSNVTFIKSHPVVLSYYKSATFTFVGSQPPFSPNANVTIKVTAKNSTSGALGSKNINLTFFEANGQAVGWFAPMNATTDENGTVQFSFRINGSATPGQYIADTGASSLISSVKLYSLAAGTLDATTLGSKNVFAPGATVMLQAKLADSSGNAIANTSVDYVNATVATPAGTSTTVPMTYNATGVYRYPFTTTSSSGIYTVTIKSSAGSNAEETSTIFGINYASVRLERPTGFFKEWGNKQVISPGSSIRLLVVGTNLANGDQLAANSAVNGTNCTSINITSFVNQLNGTDLTSTVQSGMSTGVGMYMMSSACSLTFTAPSATGIYQMKVNATMNVSGQTVTAEALTTIPVQRYVLKANPISLISDMDRKMPFSMLTPGETAYFNVKARNISGSNDITNITSLIVLGLMPMGEFSAGSANYIPFYPANYSFNATSAIMSVVIPTTVTGPATIDLQAVVEGEPVRGDGFFMAKYVMGYIAPTTGGKRQGEGGEAGGQAGGPGGGPSEGEGDIASCVAGVNMSLMGHVFDVKSFEAKQSVIVSLDSVREEATGKDVTSCFSTPGATTTESGTANITLALSSDCTYAGRYFAVWNTYFQGKSDKIPGAFNCKNLNFWPSIADYNFDRGLADEVNITVSSIYYTQNSSLQMNNGTITLRQIMNFDPSTGPLPYALTGAVTANISGGQGQITLTPSLVGRTQWRSGYTDMLLRVCDLSGTCDEAYTGFKTSAFKAFWANMTTAFGTSARPGQSLSYGMFVYDTLNTSATTVKLMNFESPEPTTLTNFTFENVSAGLNGNYRLNVTLPEDTKRGEYGLMVKLFNANMSEGSIESFLRIYSFTVYGMESQRRGGPKMQWYGCGDPNPNGCIRAGHQEGFMNWNMSYINQTLGGIVNGSSYLSIEDTPFQNNQLLIMSVWNDTAGGYTCAFMRTRSGNPNPSGPYYLYQNFTGTAYITEFDSADGVVWWVDINNKRKEWPWAGRHKLDTSFVVPLYVARQIDPYDQSAGFEAQSNVTVSITKVAKMYDSGKGIESMLTLNAGSEGYATTSAVTGANGLAFPIVRITNASYAKLFWKGSRGSTNEYANFDDAPFAQIISYQTEAFLFARRHVIPLAFYPNLTVANFSIAADKSPTSTRQTFEDFADTPGCPNASTGIYYGNYSEAVYGPDSFIADRTSRDWNAQSIVTTFHFVLANCSGVYNLTFVDDDLNLNSSGASGNLQNERSPARAAGEYEDGYFYLNYPSSDPWLEWPDARIYTPAGSTTNLTLLTESRDREFMQLSAATTPVYGRACANEFNQSKLVNANITVKYQEFQPMAPPTQIFLNTTSLTSGASMPTTDSIGCAYFEVRPHAGWPACGAADAEVMARFTSTDNRGEETWFGKVCYRS